MASATRGLSVWLLSLTVVFSWTAQALYATRKAVFTKFMERVEE